MQPKKLKVAFPAMHGEKAGVGSVLGMREYERLTSIKEIEPFVSDYEPISDEEFNDFCGDSLGGSLIKENAEDCAKIISKEHLVECWNEIRRIIDASPRSEYLEMLLNQLDAKRTLSQIGVDESELDIVLWYSPMVRNRLTLMRIRHMLKKCIN